MRVVRPAGPQSRRTNALSKRLPKWIFAHYDATAGFNIKSDHAALYVAGRFPVAALIRQVQRDA